MLVLLYSDSAPAIWSDFFCNIFIFLLTFFFYFGYLTFQESSDVFILNQSFSFFIKGISFLYTLFHLLFIRTAAKLEKESSWNNTYQKTGFFVGKTTVESISSAKFIAMYAWSHMHDGYLIDWIIHQNAPWRKHWKGALNWVQCLTHWHEFQVTCPYPVW